MKNKRVYYFVEGQCEKKLVDALKSQPSLVLPGKVKVFNPITKTLTPNDLVTVSLNSMLVFIFDTDIERNEILEQNIKMIKRFAPGRTIVLIPQVKTIEDELVRACDVKHPMDLTESKSLSNFKTAFCALKDCRRVLETHKLEVNQLWILNPNGAFESYKQQSYKIKIQ